MSLVYPGLAAILLLALPLAWFALHRYERRRARELAGFGQLEVLGRSSAIPSQRSLAARQALRLCAVSLAVLALARPQFGERAASLATSGRDVLVLLDLSRSMNAADRDQSRLAAAKSAVLDVVEKSPGHRFGLVVFGGSAFLQLPLTTDRAAFQRFLEAATTDDLANPGTDLSRALSAAITTFEHEGERGSQTVVLVSDGESVEGDIGPPLRRLREAGVPVFSIGIGTLEGAPVPADSAAGSERWHRDHIGRVVLSRLEEGDLRRAAIETNGLYVRWEPGAAEILLTGLAKLGDRTLSSRTSPERADQFQWPLGLAILILAIDPLFGVKRRTTKALAADERR